MPQRIDAHTHSLVSDGTDTPTELMTKAAAAGLDVVALTDHDGTGGWAEATAALPPGLALLPGLEISAIAYEEGPDGERRGVPLHLLGYLVDPDDPALVAECAALREGRRVRARRMLEAIAADGHPVDIARVDAAAGGAIGRPHIAAELIRLGLVDSIKAAFSPEWIGNHGRYYVTERKVDVLAAIGLVRAAGGVAVFAHPGAAERGPVVDETTIVAMAGAGLFGLEVDHPDHDAPTRARLRGLAADLGLVATGSSDYHGTHKTTRLGENTTAPEVLDAVLAAATSGQGLRRRSD